MSGMKAASLRSSPLPRYDPRGFCTGLLPVPCEQGPLPLVQSVGGAEQVHCSLPNSLQESTACPSTPAIRILQQPRYHTPDIDGNRQSCPVLQDCKNAAFLDE